MKITSVRIKKNNSDNNNTLLGIASVQFDNCLIIHDVKLIQLENKRIVSFPNKKVKKYFCKFECFLNFSSRRNVMWKIIYQNRRILCLVEKI